MMMTIAGGPGAVHPIDFGDRRRSMPRWMMVAIGASVLAHGAVGVVLYQQRFTLNLLPTAPEPSPVIVSIEDLPPIVPPQPMEARPVPPALNAPVHQTPAPIVPTETVVAVPSEAITPAPGPVVTLARPVPTEATGATAASVVEPPRGPPVITQPDWISRPTGAQLLAAYPARAMERGLTGSATLSCQVRTDGRLSDCAVRDETPASHGFGRAALSLSRYFRISPRTIDGQAVDGARVSVGLRFTLPED